MMNKRTPRVAGQGKMGKAQELGGWLTRFKRCIDAEASAAVSKKVIIKPEQFDETSKPESGLALAQTENENLTLIGLQTQGFLAAFYDDSFQLTVK